MATCLDLLSASGRHRHGFGVRRHGGIVRQGDSRHEVRDLYRFTGDERTIGGGSDQHRIGSSAVVGGAKVSVRRLLGQEEVVEHHAVASGMFAFAFPDGNIVGSRAEGIDADTGDAFLPGRL